MTSPRFPDDWQCQLDRIVAKCEPFGRVTIEELNEELPAGEVTSDVIERVLGALSERGIEVVDE